MPLDRGTLIGAYEIVAPLGAGGMGEVYRARDRRLERDVAIKILPQELASSDERLKRFDREARCASALNHPNVVTVYDVGRYASSPYIVMEYVEGRSLKAVLDEGPLPEDKALNYAAQIARGLARAHAAGIIHRDLKPANIMISLDELLKILDFGLAKLLEEPPRVDSGVTAPRSPGITAFAQILGTPHYMSPEQSQGLPLDHRTDIWSLGVVLYAMVKGRPPFQAASHVDLMHAIVHETPEPLGDEGVQGIVDRALSKEPRHRYVSAEAMIVDLEEPSRAARQGSSMVSTLAGRPTSVLPPRLTGFIGREREQAAVQAALGTTRLLTLTGPAGTGKTSLAIEATRDFTGGFADGAHFVSLAAIRNPELVASTIAESLGLNATGGGPILERVVEHLRNKNILLLLDNFEQVVDAAGMLSELLKECEHLKLLVTSRASLRISAERELPVPPLTLPGEGDTSPERLLESEAVALFVQRARCLDPSFVLDGSNTATVSGICHRLDGLPLALELAAARTRLLPPQALLSRLGKQLDLLGGGARDGPERHQTLRGAIEWSYELLDEDGKVLLRRLSGFSGGCSLDAAEAVVEAVGPGGRDVLDGVAELLDQSMLHREKQADGEPRLLMLESIRLFGLEKLAAAGEDDTFRHEHASYFLAFAEEAEPKLTGAEQGIWLDRLSQEHDNLRAALDWLARDAAGVSRGLRLAAALWRFWLARGPWREGRARLEQLIAAARPERHGPDRACALNAAASLAQNLGDLASARDMYEKSLTFWRKAEDTKQIATTLVHLAWVHWRMGEFDRTRELSEEGLELHQQLGNEAGVATALTNLGVTALYRGEYDEARPVLEEVALRRRASGDVRSLSWALSNLGLAAYRQGDPGRARRLLEEALELVRGIGEIQYQAYAILCLADLEGEEGNNDLAMELLQERSLPLARTFGDIGVARILIPLGNAFRRRGEVESATDAYRRSLTMRRQAGDKWGMAEALERLGSLGRELGDRVTSTRCYSEALSLNRDMRNRQGILDCLEGLAGRALDEGHGRVAARLFGRALALRKELGVPVPHHGRTPRERDLSELRTALGSQEFNVLWVEGLKMELEEAIDLALTLE